jgi:hypothetical protein
MSPPSHTFALFDVETLVCNFMTLSVTNLGSGFQFFDITQPQASNLSTSSVTTQEKR